MKRRMPNASLWCRTFGSHFVLLEYPDELSTKLEKFLMTPVDGEDDIFLLAFEEIAREEARVAVSVKAQDSKRGGKGRSKSRDRKAKK